MHRGLMHEATNIYLCKPSPCSFRTLDYEMHYSLYSVQLCPCSAMKQLIYIITHGMRYHICVRVPVCVMDTRVQSELSRTSVPEVLYNGTQRTVYMACTPHCTCIRLYVCDCMCAVWMHIHMRQHMPYVSTRPWCIYVCSSFLYSHGATYAIQIMTLCPLRDCNGNDLCLYQRNVNGYVTQIQCMVQCLI